jgi:RimJ/RimL family protein N-acetyltransferase
LPVPRIPPAIESARLILRMPVEDDCAPLQAYYGDADSVRYTLGSPCTPAQTWRTLALVAGHWAWRGYGPYTLQDRRSGPVLGLAGLWFPSEWPEPEIKWALIPTARGQGYAAEAARAVRSMAREHLPGLRLISLILPANEPSVRVAEAVGARFEREIDFRGGRAAIYRHVD